MSPFYTRMTSSKFIVALALVGILIILAFGIDLLRNRGESKPQFDFSGATRPQWYPESPVRGPTNASVVMYEYSDFGCPHCRDMQSVLARVRSKYQSKVLHVWKDFPFLSQSSKDAAAAARCAGRQDAFWEYHDWLFANQSELSSLSFADGARQLGIDSVSFTACLLDDRITTVVSRDFAEGRALGVDQTPTLVIGGVALVGVQTFEEVEQVLVPLLQE